MVMVVGLRLVGSSISLGQKTTFGVELFELLGFFLRLVIEFEGALG